MKLTILLALLLQSAAIAQSRWVSTWYTPPAVQRGAADMLGAKLLFQNQTLREVVRTTIGGKAVRVVVSNVYGSDFLQVGAVHLALRAAGASTVTGSDHALTFSGRAAIVIPPNALMMSDPVVMDVPQGGDLAVSVYLPQTAAGAGVHYAPSATSYIGAGNQTAATAFQSSGTVASWAFLASVEVLAAENAATIVTFGDSITDGARSTVDANHRWPDYLAARLVAAGMTNLGVVNSGIGGNRILHDPGISANARFGPNALSRFERDVLARPGAKYVMILEGINDLGHPGTGSAPLSEAVTAEDIIAGLRQMADRAHQIGMKVIVGTITPFAGFPSAGY